MAINIQPLMTIETLNQRSDGSNVMDGLNQRVVAKRAGRKPSGKVVVSLRLEPDVLEAWRSTGPGYQSRIADLLKRHAPLPLKGC